MHASMQQYRRFAPATRAWAVLERHFLNCSKTAVARHSSCCCSNMSALSLTRTVQGPVKKRTSSVSCSLPRSLGPPSRLATFLSSSPRASAAGASRVNSACTWTALLRPLRPAGGLASAARRKARPAAYGIAARARCGRQGASAGSAQLEAGHGQNSCSGHECGSLLTVTIDGLELACVLIRLMRCGLAPCSESTALTRF